MQGPNAYSSFFRKMTRGSHDKTGYLKACSGKWKPLTPEPKKEYEISAKLVRNDPHQGMNIQVRFITVAAPIFCQRQRWKKTYENGS